MKLEILNETVKLMLEIERLRAERKEILLSNANSRSNIYGRQKTRLKHINKRLYELTDNPIYKH